MTVIYDYGQYTVNSKSVHLKWLEAHIDDVTVRNVGDKTCGNSGYYGINGTFFSFGTNNNPCDSGDSNDLIGIAIQNGSSVKFAGHQNVYNLSSGRGTLVRLINNLQDGTFIFEKKFQSFPTTQNGYTVNQSNVKWAVGGISLLLGQTLTESGYNSAISGESPPAVSTDRPRTAIGYKGGNKVILCAIFDGDELWNGGIGYGCNLWDVRTIMKDKFGCTMGVNLDGGGSTQISYKLNGQNYYHQTESRCIQSMITVPM